MKMLVTSRQLMKTQLTSKYNLNQPIRVHLTPRDSRFNQSADILDNIEARLWKMRRSS